MDKKMKELIIDYVDGNLSGELAEFVQKQIEKDSDLALEYRKLQELSALMKNSEQYEPSSVSRDNFLLAMEEELEQLDEPIKKNDAKITSWNMSWRVAAAMALIAVSFATGRWLWNDSTERSQLAGLQKEMAETKSLVLSSLENTTSASTRLNGINVAYEKGSVDKEVIRVLIKTMNEDENVNVRLAAVRALAKFSDEPGVTQALVNALENQKEALVQIALINLMVELQEKGVLDKLRQIIEDENALDAVKDEAHMAVFKLS
ncbi:MAG: HEAT repeat domain-containing protein [Bacteroidota bacterium]